MRVNILLRLISLRALLTIVLLVSICVSPAAAQKPARVTLKTIAIKVDEGTTLSFDVSPDRRSIVFDLLGQLWLTSVSGGKAKPITDAVRDTAEDLDPSFSPDGRSLVFRGERNGRTGLWLLDLASGKPRQLVQLSNPEGYTGNAAWSPDGRSIAFAQTMFDTAANNWRSVISLFEVATGSQRQLAITGIKTPFLSDPVWLEGGKQIAFVARVPQTSNGGRIWRVPVAGGEGIPVAEDSVNAIAPAFSEDGRLVAYFERDSTDRFQIWVRQINESGIATGAPLKLTNHVDVAPTRIRWLGENELIYSADGRLWKIAATGGNPTEIRFTVALSLNIPQRDLPPARFPEPGVLQPARGFMGLALSPDGREIAMLALGKLWLIPIDGSPRAVAEIPFDASSPAWSPGGAEIAWSAGVSDQEDLFATDLKTGVTRRVTALPGREAYPTYSPDGRYLAFAHIAEDGVLRTVAAQATGVGDVSQTKSLGSIGLTLTSPPRWSPESDGLLVPGSAEMNMPGRATFVTLSGQRQEITRFPVAPIFLQWTPQHTIVFVRHDRLWQAAFDRNGLLAEPKSLGTAAALYASASNDGTILFVSAGGLRLRTPDGVERSLGWPISYTPPTAAPMLIRSVRIVDGTGGPVSTPRDVLIEEGRIKQIGPAGTLASSRVQVLDAGGRIMIPGLVDLHAHTYRPDLLPGFVYFGVTTIRDQGSSMAPLVAYADDIASGVLPGPRVSYGGFQFYSDWPFDEEQGRGIEPEADPDHIRRAVDLAEAFGAQHIKTRTFRRWDLNARMIAEAHRRGMRATGHCSHLLPLVAAGMDAKEHIGLCESRGNTYMYDDMIQLFRAAGIGVVPTLSYFQLAVQLSERPTLLDGDAALAPFMPARENFNWMFKLNAAARKRWLEEARNAREATSKLARAGVTIGAGTDIWQIPTGVHMELEQLVAAGLTPAQAIHAATGAAAEILGAQKHLGTIEAGKWADLVILDADPLSDIRNTRRIWQVVYSGHLVDRPAILKTIHPR